MTDSKKFVIKPFKARVQMDRNSATTTWAGLAGAIDEIHNRNTSTLSFEELYRNSYNLVIQKHGELLYQGVQDKLSGHLMRTAKKLADATEITLLDDSSQSFIEHTTTMVMIRDILMYMDRSYVDNHHKLPVYELGLRLFRTIVWEHQNVQSRVSDLLLQRISNERAGELTDDRTLLKKILGMLQQLDQAGNSKIYERDFDSRFLGTTQEFYQTESSMYLAHNSASSYVQKAKSRIEEEKNRAKALSLPPSTEGPLMEILEKELIDRHAERLVTMENSGFAVLLKDDTKVDEMREMYDLFCMVREVSEKKLCVDFLREALCNRVKEDGRALVADMERGASDPTTFVQGILKMDERYRHIVDYSFRGEGAAKKKLKQSFELFLNADERAASCLAVYADDLLKSKLKGIPDEKARKLLDSIILVFRYIKDKDIFEKYYKERLAKRLLDRRSISDDAEKMVVSLLKAEIGFQFTTKLEGMFNDMRISHETQTAYKDNKRQRMINGEQMSNGVDMDVEILTEGYWPKLNVPACNLPESVNIAIGDFEGFYLKKYTGRKLSWQTSTGSAEIKANYGNGTRTKRYDLIISTYQMCILMLFNDKDTLTVKEISDKTNVPDAELKRHLISLSTPRHRILRKGSKGKGISGDDDTFTYNPNFTSKSRKVRIPMVSLRSKAATNTAAVESDGNSLPPDVERERCYALEAAIVRIMKARKTLNHNDLIFEVTNQSTLFTPPTSFIKKRIEALIDREYLERDDNDHRLYKYIA